MPHEQRQAHKNHANLTVYLTGIHDPSFHNQRAKIITFVIIQVLNTQNNTTYYQ